MMYCLVLLIRNGVHLKVLVWAHCFLSYTLVNSLKLQVVIFLMFMFMLMIDTQLYISFSPNDIDEQLNTLSAIEDCIAAIRSWMSKDQLKLNDDKTEFFSGRYQPTAG